MVSLYPTLNSVRRRRRFKLLATKVDTYIMLGNYLFISLCKNWHLSIHLHRMSIFILTVATFFAPCCSMSTAVHLISSHQLPSAILLSFKVSNQLLFHHMISQVISGKFSLDVDKLLQDCRILPSPQDLRYAVFAAGASQNSFESVKKDLPILRKSCIVRVLGPLRFEMGLPNSITAVISVHECYPEVRAVLPFI